MQRGCALFHLFVHVVGPLFILSSIYLSFVLLLPFHYKKIRHFLFFIVALLSLVLFRGQKTTLYNVIAKH
ncbi:hypothetical protein F5146DRAFT_1018083, partial [Armillaria mellea]